jgi:alpha-1,6-mannosyltransferase
VVAVRRASARRLVAIGLVAVIFGATAILLSAPADDLGPYPVLAAMLASFAALALLLGRESLRRALTIGGVLAASGALLAGSALAPERSSDDVWSYAMYGRAIVEHRANPYVHAPEDFADDPMLGRVNQWFRDRPARYGPLFVSITAVVALGVGDHPLPTRLAYQVLAAAAVFVALVLVARRTRSPAAVAAVGLNPVTAYVVVNGAHNDALIGLAVVSGVLLATRDRHMPATLAFTAAALIKVTAGLALVAYLAWLAYRRGPRTVIRAAAVAAGVTVVGLLAFGFDEPIRAILGARGDILPHSPLMVFASGGIRNLLSYGYDVDFSSVRRLATIGNVIAVVVAAIFVWNRIRDKTPLYVVSGALLAYLFVSVYTAPWFAIWVFPVLALHWRWRASICALAFFAVVAIDDRLAAAVAGPAFFHEHTFEVLLANWVNTLAMVAAVVSVVVLLFSRRPEPSPDDDVGQRARVSSRQPASGPPPAAATPTSGSPGT